MEQRKEERQVGADSSQNVKGKKKISNKRERRQKDMAFSLGELPSSL